MADNDAEDLGAIFNDAFSNDRDRGDTSAPPAVEKEEPVAETVAEAPPVEAPPAEPEPKEVIQGRDPKSGKFVPVTELVETRNKLKAERDEEARLRKEAEDRANQYQAKVEAYERSLQARQQPQQQAQPEPEIPSPEDDPIGHLNWQIAQLGRQNMAIRVNISEQRAIDQHGEEAVREAEAMAIKQGLVNNILSQKDPYRSLMDWYRRGKVLREVGPDPEAYRAKIEAETREKVLAEIKAQGLPSGGTTATQKFPTSLAAATSAGGDEPETPESIFTSAFSQPRRRRG